MYKICNLALASLLYATSAQSIPLAGYAPGSDVVEHSEIDLDLREISSFMAAGDSDAAYDLYSKGKNSAKTTSLRSIRGFSTAALSKMQGQAMFSKYWSYHGGAALDGSYADTFVRRAMDGTTAPGSAIARKELAVKGISYQAVWMYVLRELEDAVDDCRSGDLTANDAKVHAWDEGWAFYAGSEEGQLEGGDPSTSSGTMPYRLAEKRCQNFNTCETGISAVNRKLLVAFDTGRDALLANDCDAAAAEIKKIAVQMTIPLIQGSIRYAILGDGAFMLDSTTPGPKAFAEGWAFTAAVLPQVAYCNVDAAALIERNMMYGVDQPVADGHAKVVKAYESVYKCLGITCSDIGAYQVFGAPAACDDVALLEAARDKIAGYSPGSNVVQHNRLDIDVLNIATYLKVGDYEHAREVYENGANSLKSTSIRSLMAFSNNDEKLKGERLADLFADYWGSYAYADQFVQAALDGTGNFHSAGQTARKELALKGIQYQVVWMYVVHEMEDALGDCERGELNNNDAGVHAWDEAWAFYTGSLEGTDGSGSGQMLYALADKRCANFNTCSYSGHAAVNERLLRLFQQGERALQQGKCSVARKLFNRITPLMTVPLIQGSLRYAILADPEITPGAGQKARAEGWAFTAAVLPLVHSFDPDAATTLRRNMEWSADSPVADGYRAVFDVYRRVLSKLQLNCKDIGEYLVPGSATEHYPGADTCQDLSSKPHVPLELHGSGTTNPSMMIWKMLDTLKVRFGSPIFMGYRAVGSSTGVEEFKARANHFACSEVALSEADREEFVMEHLHLPTFVGTVSVFHNVPENKLSAELALTAELLAEIMQGGITVWDHPDILAQNPGLKVPAGELIKVVRRTKGSSSTYALSDYLSKAAGSAWTLGTGTVLNWPAGGIDVEGSSGMTAEIKATAYTIGYSDSHHGLSLGLKEALLQNKDGQFLTSATASPIGALAGLQLPAPDESWAGVSLVNQAGPNTWPMTAFTYMLVQKDLTDFGETGVLLQSWLEYVHSTEAAAMATEFGFTQVPASIVTPNLAAIADLIVDPDVKPFAFEHATTPVIGAGPRVFSSKRKTHTDLLVGEHEQKVAFLMKENERLSALVEELLFGGASAAAESCKSRCGGKSQNGKCHCDTVCLKQKVPDCCADFEAICPDEAKPGSGCSGFGC